jgi:hypothetical protein
MNTEQRIKELERRVQDLEGRRTQVDFLPKSIKQRFLEAQLIFFGLEDDLPSDGAISQKRAYFATDTDTLYIWNGTDYVSVVLS